MMASPAMRAKARARGPTVLEQRAAQHLAEATAAAVVEEPPLVHATPVASEMGKASKSGFLLARAQLASSASGVVAALDRQAALVGKVPYRKAEHVAREQAVGSLAVKDMPKKKGSTDGEAFSRDFGAWMRKALVGKKKQARTAAGYEKMVLTIHEWMVERALRGRG